MNDTFASLDPALSGGKSNVIFDREVPIEVRIQEGDAAPSEVGQLHALRARVLVQGAEAGTPRQVKIEVTSDTDLFFMYTATVSSDGFKDIAAAQKLAADFVEYPSILSQSFTQAIESPQSVLAVLIIHKAGPARLDFIQSIAYLQKFVELLSVDLERADEAAIRESVTFRYNALKSRYAALQAHVQDVQAIVRQKNPTLLAQLQGPGAGGAAMAGDASGSFAGANMSTRRG